MPKLYECQIDVTMFVIADDEFDAQMIAYDNLREETNNLSHADFSTSEAVKIEQVPSIWRKSIPYGDNDDEQTVAEFLQNQPDVA